MIILVDAKVHGYSLATLLSLRKQPEGYHYRAQVPYRVRHRRALNSHDSPPQQSGLAAFEVKNAEGGLGVLLCTCIRSFHLVQQRLR